MSRAFSDTEVYLYDMTSCTHTTKFFTLQNEVIAYKLLVGNGPWPMLIPQLHWGVVQVVLLGINQNHVRDYVKNLTVCQVKYYCMEILPGTVQFSSMKAGHTSLSLICLGHFKILWFLMGEHTAISFYLQAIHPSLLH